HLPVRIPPASPDRASPSSADASRLSRRSLLRAAGGGLVAVASAGALYDVLSHLTASPQRTTTLVSQGYPTGQYQIADYGVHVMTYAKTAIPVDIPPLWNVVITARLTRTPGLIEQQRLTDSLAAIEQAYPYTPAGVFTLVAYGLPYFRAYVQPEIFA